MKNDPPDAIGNGAAVHYPEKGPVRRNLVELLISAVPPEKVPTDPVEIVFLR